jgi:hypothetical protein
MSGDIDKALATLTEAGEKAMAGPWKECGDILQGRSAIRTALKDLFCSYDEMSMQNANDARFIALARNVWPELMAALREARVMRRYCLGSDASTENMLKRFDAALAALAAKVTP